MPEPISSQSTTPTYDPTVDEGGQQCRNDAPNRSEMPPPSSSSPAVAKLVSAANNNAQRTSELSGIAPHLAAGKTAAGDSVYVSVAGLKGHDPKSGLEVEVLSASEQKGLQLESQAALLRVGKSDATGSFNIESFTIRATHGIHNDDGSTGYNVSGLATALGGEVTLNHGADSVTLGLAAGVGAAGSIGLRDIDGDGDRELCFKASIEAFTVGACVETPL